MSVDDREVPLAHLPESLLKLPYQGNQSVSFEFEWSGRKFVMKELKHNNEDYRVLGSDPVEVARASNEFYRLIKKHFGDRVVDTSYLVARDRAGVPTVVAVQPKIEGKNLQDVVNEGDGHVAVAMGNKLLEFEKTLEEVIADPDWKKLPERAQEYFSYSARELNHDNVIQTPDGRYVLIDF